MDLDYEWYVVCSAHEIAPSKVKRVELFDHPIAVFRDSAGVLHALDDRCPHLSASLSLGKVEQDGTLACVFHGLRFADDGNCVAIPGLEKGTRIPKAMCTRSWAVREVDGWIFLFWGPREEARGEPARFPEIHQKLTYATSVHEWPVHFSRVIENQLDHAHLPFVHRTTIGAGGPFPLEVAVKLDEQSVWTRISNQPGSMDHQFTKLIYPNLWINYLHPKFIVQVAFVPAGKERTKLYLRGYQGFVPRWAGGQLAAWLARPINDYIVSQDAKAVGSQTPKSSVDVRGETLLSYDAAIAAYRQLAQKKRRQNKRALELLAE